MLNGAVTVFVLLEGCVDVRQILRSLILATLVIESTSPERMRVTLRFISQAVARVVILAFEPIDFVLLTLSVQLTVIVGPIR